MANLWTAFDLTTLNANTEAALVIGVTIAILFVGYKLIKKAGRVL